MSGESGRFAAGFALCILAGICNGSWQLPLKPCAPAPLRIVNNHHSGWQFENAWLVYTALSIVLELIIAYTVLGSMELEAIYAEIPGSTLALIIIFSVLWGFGSIGFGLAVQMLGIAIGTSLCIGVVMVVGTLLPLLYIHLDEAGSYAFSLTIVGAAVGVVGFALSAAAGSCDPSPNDDSGSSEALKSVASGQKSATVDDSPPANSELSKAIFGVIVAIVGGILAVQLQFAFVFGQPAITEAMGREHHPIAASQTVWLFAFTISGSVNVVYAIIELFRRQTWSRFLSPSGDVNISDSSPQLAVSTVAVAEKPVLAAGQHPEESSLSLQFSDDEEHQISNCKDINDVPDKESPVNNRKEDGCSNSDCSSSNGNETILSYSVRNSCLSFGMTLLWMAHITIYGYSQALMGQLGAGIAWPLIMISTVSTGQFWSWILGEWETFSPLAVRYNSASLLVQFVAVLIIAIGNSV